MLKDRLTFVSDLSRHVGDDINHLIAYIVKFLPEVCEVEHCTLFLVDEDDQSFVVRDSSLFGFESIGQVKISMKREGEEPLFSRETFVFSEGINEARLPAQYLSKFHVRSLVSIPLKVREKVLGLLHLANTEKDHHFAPEEVSLFNALAAEISLAIESTMLEAERKARATELENFRQEVQSYFTQIGKAISSDLSLESFLSLVADLSMRVTKADGCSIFLFQEGYLDRKIAAGITPNLDEIIPLRSLKNEPSKNGEPSLCVRTSLQIPLITQDKTIGLLNIYNRKEGTFSRDKIDVLETFAAQAALSIQNLRLFQAEQEKAREISAVYESAKSLSAPLELSEILMEAAQQMCFLGGVNRCFIFLLDEERKILVTSLVHGVSDEQKEFFSALAIPLSFLEGDLWHRFKQGKPLVLLNQAAMEQAIPLKSLFRVFGTQTCLLAPLLSERRLTGLIYLDKGGVPYRFTESQIRSVMALSIHAATSIERAQLYKQLEDQAKQVHTLYQISTALSTSLNLDRILNLIIEKTTQLVHAERFCLFVWDDDKNVFTVAASRGLSEEFIAKAIVRIEDRFVGLASHRRKPVYSANVLLETENPQLSRLFKKEGLGAVLAVPLVTKRKTIGVITLFAELGYQFKEKEVHLLGNFASHAALCVENAKLYNTNKQKVQELGILFDVGKRINEHLNPQEVLRSMAEQFLSIMKSDGCSIMLLDKDEKMLTIQATRGVARTVDLGKKIKLGQGLVGKVAKSGIPLCLHDQGEEGFPKIFRDLGVHTILSVPLSLKGQIIGVINLYNRELREYAPSEMHLMETLAVQGAVAVRNAQIFQDHYHVAQLIQKSLLPLQIPTSKGYELGFQYVPSQEISGDYYDFLELPGKLGVTIADVSGKGASAAIFTAQGKYAWKAYALLEEDPQQVLSRLNNLMVHETPSEKFISLFYGVLDLKKKEFVYSNAGHLPPLLYRADTQECSELNAPGFLLGIDEEAEFAKKSVSLHSGDVLVFYTDGVTEARNEAREMFGIQSLQAIVSENASFPAQVIANRILTTVRKFSRRRNLEDDITVVILKIH